jgi:hypothetical protein
MTVMNVQFHIRGSLVHMNIYWSTKGRAIAQAVSRRLPTAAARVRAHVRQCGIYGGQSGTGAGFLRLLQFPLPILIPPMLHIYHHLSFGAGTIGQIPVGVRSGLSVTPSQETKWKKLLINQDTTQWPSIDNYNTDKDDRIRGWNRPLMAKCSAPP